MGNILPTLSSSGWVEEIAEKADRTLSYFFVSEHSQSETFRGSVSSLPRLIQQFGNDPLTLKSETGRRLEDYLSRYFDEVSTDVSITNEDQPHSKMDLQIAIRVRDGGNVYSLARLVKTVNGKIEELIRINNEG